MPRGREIERLDRILIKMQTKLKENDSLDAQADEWVLELEAFNQSQGAMLGFPPSYLHFKGENKSLEPCLAQFSFMAVTAPKDGFETKRIILTVLLAVLVIWLLIGLLFYLSYLMVKRRHLISRADQEMEPPIAAPKPASHPLPQGPARGGYKLSELPAKKKRKPQKERPEKKKRRTEKPPQTHETELDRQELEGLHHPEFGERLNFPDFRDDEPFPDEDKLGR